MKALNPTVVESVSKLKFFYNCTCRKDAAKFLNAFEMSDDQFAKKACKLFKIEPSSTVLQTAKNLLKEVQNGKSQKKTDSKSNGTVPGDKEKKESKVSKKQPTTSVEASKSNPDNSPISNPVLKIDPDIEKLIPKASKKHYALIRESIKTHGFREEGDFIEILKDGTIIDGHTRYRICKELKVEIPPNAIKVIDEDIEKVIKIKNVARRHLSNLEKIELVKEEWQKIEKKLGNGRKAREQKAKSANISESEVQRHDFLNRYAPDRLEAIHNKEEEFHPALEDVKKKVSAIRESKPELLKQVEEGEINLDEAFSQIKSKKTKKEKKDLIYIYALELKEFTTRMIKKYNKNKFTIDDNPEGRTLKEILGKLDTTIEKFGGE